MIEKGTVLISVLLFLLIITLLSFSAFNSAIIEEKMNSNYQEMIFSLQNAENLLSLTEEKIRSSSILPTGVVELATKFCAVKIYQVTVMGRYQKTITCLRSTFALVGDTKACHPKPPLHTGRLSWRVLE